MNDVAVTDDLSALAWVHGELRRSLEAAHKSLRRYLKDAESVSGGDLDAVDPAVMRSARTQLHQGVGALELVGLPALADVLRASESAVQRLMNKPALADAAAVDVIERVSFALLDYLGRFLARKPVSPVMLFPQYRAAMQLAAADRVHPADLWKLDWQWIDLPDDSRARPRAADDEARDAMESLVLQLMRDSHKPPTRGGGDGGQPPLVRMSDLCADLGAGARQRGHAASLSTLWQLAAAVFEAQAAGLLASDVYTKRMASRLLAQLRGSSRGSEEASDRLAQDLLFFCAHAQKPASHDAAPRLAAVRRAWRLTEHPVSDYDTVRLGRFDPAHLQLAKKRVAAAKDSWSAVAGGEEHRLGNLPEQFALVGESLTRLFPNGDVLAAALQATVEQTVGAGRAPSAPLAMEVATGILYIDASLEDGELDLPELGERVRALAGRVAHVRGGGEPQPLDSWMEELYRRVSDRQTMGSVVSELRASLSEVEKHIDHYFRNPAERQVLIPVPAQLSSMRGVLSVLGMEQASQAALFMRDDVDALAQTEVDPQRAIETGTFDRLADNLGALSFLIDMLSVQPQLAKSLFKFDPETGLLSAVMGKTERVSAFAQLDEHTGAPSSMPAPLPGLTLLEQVQALGAAAAQSKVSDLSLARDAERLAQQALAADEPELAKLLKAAHEGLHEGNNADTRRAMRNELAAVVASLNAAPEPASAPAPVPAPKPAPAGGTGLEDDPEMREIFIEEAREVINDATAAVKRLETAPDSTQDMTAVRRGFHTLKGSSRMVGLKDFGEAAWSCEQLFNARLASAPHMDEPLRLLTSEALTYLGGWVEAINASRNEGHVSADVSLAADALRLDNKRVPIGLPKAPAVAAKDSTTISFVRTAATPAPETTVAWQREAEPVLPPAPAPAHMLDSTTVILPDSTAPSERPEFERDDATFELALPDLDTPLAPAPRDLIDRIPDLPLAAELDLTLRDLGQPPAPEPASTPVEALDFELDLGGLDDAPTQPIEPLPLPDEVQAIELDLSALEAEFAPVPPATSLLVPLPQTTEVVLDAQVSAEDLSLGFEAEHATIAEDQPGPETAPEPLAQPGAEPVAEPAAELAPPPAPESSDEQVKIVGDLRISIPLFNIYLNEADELSRRLVTELGEWAHESEHQPVSENAVALAHSLAGSSATVGYTDLSALARALEHALMRSQAAGRGRAGEVQLFTEVADEIRRLLHQFAAGFLRPVGDGFMEQLAAHERMPLEAAERPAGAPVPLVESTAVAEAG
jgi:chemosensory pili system protein ChpA (sensor histidine kinase/response regulator)